MSETSRLLFVTVGTTAITAEELGAMYRDVDKRKDLVEDLHHYQGIDDDLGKDADAAEHDLFRRVLEAHRTHWKTTLSISAALYRTSAEMTSTYFLMHAREQDGGVGGMFRPEHDRIVLLSSDTAIGKLCARVNAQLMHEFLFAPQCTGNVNFGQAEACRACGSLYIEVVDKMESKTEFKGITVELEKIIDKRVASGGARMFLNITGGYKGAIPSITFLCATRYKKCPLFYQHESMKKAVRIDFRPELTESLIPLVFV